MSYRLIPSHSMYRNTNMNDILVFTLRDLNKSGGGAIRINSLIKVLNRVKNLKVASNTHGFSSCEHLELRVIFSTLEKRLFQVLVSFFPMFLLKILFWSKLAKVESYIKKNFDPQTQDIIFCEYLDNSIGYYLKKRGFITDYINDIHGISTIELSHNNNRTGLLKKISVYLASKHDSKVLSEATSHIYPSNAMREFFQHSYQNFKRSKPFILPNLANSEYLDNEIDTEFINNLVVKYQIDTSKKVVFFAGGYKEIGGILDLIFVFSQLQKDNGRYQLLLVGDGYNQGVIDSLISELEIENDVIQLGLQPYNKLYSIQQLASVIVCPDKMNDYSNLIIHLKYFDSIASGKPVVCSGFDSVREVNSIGDFAVLYPPSDLEKMQESILYCIEHEAMLTEFSKNNRKLVIEQLTYDSYEDVIANLSTQ